MKKIFFAALAAALTIMTASCSTQAAAGKTLVAYFSATGTTKAVAEQVAEAAEADLFEIRPAQPYTAADLDWRDKQSRSSLEMSDKSSRPAVAAKVQRLQQYDTVYIGFPIWWGIAPTIVNTFIEENDLAGKTVRLFATSGGSGIDNACDEFAGLYPDVNWAGGKLLNNPGIDEIGWFVAGEDDTPRRQLAGGYSDQREPDEEEVAMFRKAVEDARTAGDGAVAPDAAFTPLSVATQVVAGLNYRFWCRYECKSAAESGHRMVTIFKPLPGQGDPRITKISAE